MEKYVNDMNMVLLFKDNHQFLFGFKAQRTENDR